MQKDKRIKRHHKIKSRLRLGPKTPRLAVFRSNRHIYAQIIDDVKGETLIFESDIKNQKGAKKEKAYEVGKRLAKKALSKKIGKVVFDRSGFLYHGRVAEVAKGAREGGLKF